MLYERVFGRVFSCCDKCTPAVTIRLATPPTQDEP
jgi:hypothetical protein